MKLDEAIQITCRETCKHINPPNPKAKGKISLVDGRSKDEEKDKRSENTIPKNNKQRSTKRE
jgi:hypothetical protein